MCVYIYIYIHVYICTHYMTCAFLFGHWSHLTWFPSWEPKNGRPGPSPVAHRPGRSTGPWSVNIEGNQALFASKTWNKVIKVKLLFISFLYLSILSIFKSVVNLWQHTGSFLVHHEFHMIHHKIEGKLASSLARTSGCTNPQAAIASRIAWYEFH